MSVSETGLSDDRLNLILCEGYQDRAFWKGLLRHRDCRRADYDPAGEKVQGRGRHGYRSRSGEGAYVEVVPVNSASKLLQAVRVEVREADVLPQLGTLVVNFDPDTSGTGSRTGLRAEDLVREIQAIPVEAEIRDDGSLHLPETGSAVVLAPWRCDVEERGCVPKKQTLERLVCAAVTDAYPERGEAVEAWLPAGKADRRVKDEHKAAAMSFMAGWYPARGSEDFFAAVWEDEVVHNTIIEYLRTSGVWAAVSRLLGEDSR